MKSTEELDKIEKEIEESAKLIFKKKPKEIQEELEKETILGSPKNLAEPTNIDES
ncbi:MAG: hypothetical protein GY820_25290 [Gammaproteobacteria bacterium]|nr:hypothetical protein [Gammaproteobacteria bacterium]